MVTALIGAAVATAALVAGVRGAFGGSAVVIPQRPLVQQQVTWHRVNAGGSARL